MDLSGPSKEENLVVSDDAGEGEDDDGEAGIELLISASSNTVSSDRFVTLRVLSRPTVEAVN
jgi:hypothetical protein